jgi:naphthoate synthase
MNTIDWKTVKNYQDITYQRANGDARIAFNRPECRNAFRPKTTAELLDALIHAHEDQQTGVVLLTGEGPSPKDGGWAFCSGGDQRVRSTTGYKGEDGVNRFNILDVQRQIRFMNKVVIAVQRISTQYKYM